MMDLITAIVLVVIAALLSGVVTYGLGHKRRLRGGGTIGLNSLHFEVDDDEPRQL